MKAIEEGGLAAFLLSAGCYGIHAALKTQWRAHRASI